MVKMSTLISLMLVSSLCGSSGGQLKPQGPLFAASKPSPTLRAALTPRSMAYAAATAGAKANKRSPSHVSVRPKSGSQSARSVHPLLVLDELTQVYIPFAEPASNPLAAQPAASIGTPEIAGRTASIHPRPEPIAALPAATAPISSLMIHIEAGPQPLIAVQSAPTPVSAHNPSAEKNHNPDEALKRKAEDEKPRVWDKALDPEKASQLLPHIAETEEERDKKNKKIATIAEAKKIEEERIKKEEAALAAAFAPLDATVLEHLKNQLAFFTTSSISDARAISNMMGGCCVNPYDPKTREQLIALSTDSLREDLFSLLKKNWPFKHYSNEQLKARIDMYLGKGNGAGKATDELETTMRGLRARFAEIWQPTFGDMISYYLCCGQMCCRSKVK